MASVTYLDHTADVGVRITAAGAAEAFVAAANAMFDIMVPRREVVEAKAWHVDIEADGWSDLLVVWLEELLYRYEIEQLLPASIEMRELTPRKLAAEVRGEVFDAAKHERGVQIKAVTRHQLVAEETQEGFRVQVIFDI